MVLSHLWVWVKCASSDAFVRYPTYIILPIHTIPINPTWYGFLYHKTTQNKYLILCSKFQGNKTKGINGIKQIYKYLTQDDIYIYFYCPVINIISDIHLTKIFGNECVCTCIDFIFKLRSSSHVRCVSFDAYVAPTRSNFSYEVK